MLELVSSRSAFYMLEATHTRNMEYLSKLLGLSLSRSAQACWNTARHAGREVPDHVARWRRFGSAGDGKIIDHFLEESLSNFAFRVRRSRSFSPCLYCRKLTSCFGLI